MKINKKVNSEEEAYYIYLGILQAVSGFKIAEQEKRILSVILKNKGLTKDVRKQLREITTRAVVENTIFKFRNRKILIGDTPNPRFPSLDPNDTSFTITLKPNESTGGEKPDNA